GGLDLSSAQIQGYGFVFGPFPFDQNLANVFQVQGAIPTSAKFTPSGAPQVAILSSTVYKPTDFFFTPGSLQIYAPGGLTFEGNNAILQVNGSLEVRGPLSFLTPNNHQVNGTLNVNGDLTVHNANLAVVGGTTQVQGNVSLQNGVINSALNVTGQVSGFGLTGPIQATGGIVPTAQLTGIKIETVSTELHAISLGPWLLTNNFRMAGGTLVADQGIEFASPSNGLQVIRGYGTIDATVSGDAFFEVKEPGAPGHLLSMGRSDRSNGVNLTGGIQITDVDVRLLDADEAYVFSIFYIEQRAGSPLLDIPNGLRVDFFTARLGREDLHMKITGPLVIDTDAEIFNRGSLDVVSLGYPQFTSAFTDNRLTVGELRLRGSAGHPASLSGQYEMCFDVLFAENGVLQQSDDVWNIRQQLLEHRRIIVGDAFMDGQSLAPQGVTIRGGLFGRGSVAGLVTLDGATLTTTSNFDGLTLAPRSLFSPGRDGEPGWFTIEPDAAAAFVMINDPNSVFDLGGTIRGDQYDALSIAGPLTLDGGLLVRLINGFVPQDGDRFDLF
ncbi:MAG TPA: polymer-forming cytoskeletal protein, partial [Roseimicrobium sp.]|nr:polymer-forming cytoskeletal protein [Roseimicrobium sp.]